MITEADINQAIAECIADPEPNAWTCMRMAAFLTIRQQMFGKSEQRMDPAMLLPIRGASMAGGPQTPAEEIVEYSSGTEFSAAIDGKRAAQIWPVMDEIMSTLVTIFPELYHAAMRKIKKNAKGRP